MADHHLQFNGPKRAKTCVILAHGAGESSDSKFLTYFAEELGKLGHRVARFDFPYIVQRSVTGRRRPPDREAVLLETWHDVIREVGHSRFVIGGKSMGGRIASMVAPDTQALGVVCLGYPFHPSGRPEKLRIAHLQTTETPTLIVQGEQDPFGTREEAEAMTLAETVRIHWVPESDHSFQPKRGSARKHPQNLTNASRAVERFLFEVFADSET